MSDLDRYQYGYDQNSNRLYKANVVGTSAVGYLDEGYTYDNLNRLIQMQRGNLSGGVITGTPTREMDYTLDPTGNWAAYVTKTNGTADLNQTRTANKVNEITAIGGTPAWVTPPVYDAAGNMTSFPQPSTPTSAFTATYDAWNRMVSINNSSGSVATYQYDGMGRRIVKTTTGTGGQTRHFFYTNTWQDIEERVGSSTTMDKQYVWGARYVDELVCRDDATPQRLYAMQDANFNLTSISNTSGGVVERYLFDPYGNRMIMNGSWGTISASAYSWVIGHQGLMLDGESGLIYNRARFYHPSLGMFVSRDPLAIQLTNDLNLYQYVRSAPISSRDSTGLEPSSSAYCQNMWNIVQTANIGVAKAKQNFLSGTGTLRDVQIAEVFLNLVTNEYNENCQGPPPSPPPPAPPSAPSGGGSSAAICCMAWGGRMATTGACCEAVPGPGTAIGTADIAAGSALLLIGGIIYVCTKPKDASSSDKDDCKNAAGSAAAWIAFCKTLPQSLRRSCYDKGGESVSPTERENWCNWYF